MKIALICPSNILFMPYVTNYEKILKANNIDYTIINWDRFHIEDHNEENKYRDKKIGHQRNYYDYYKYQKFLLKQLNENLYDKLIIFGLQLGHFLKSYLINNFKGKYIIDIRDYHKIIKFFNVKELIDRSDFTVISSPGYKQWLPKNFEYVINHNTIVNALEELQQSNNIFNNDKLIISYIGSLAHYKSNIEFINQIKSSNHFTVIFHGDGMINNSIEKYIRENNIRNVEVYGRYQKHEEKELYAAANLINTFLDNENINSKTCLTNRLYNSVIYGRPLLALSNSYLAEQIDKYKLGLVLDSFEDMDGKIMNYIKQFDSQEYEKGRISFFKMVINENEHFRKRLGNFCL